MRYCKKCGAYIPDADDKCPACGQSFVGTDSWGGAAQAQTANTAWSHRETGSNFNDSGEYHSGPNNGYEASRHYESPSSDKYGEQFDADALENRGMGFLCYLNILFLIPLFARPDSQFLRYHCNQGLVLTLFSILVRICYSVPVLGWIAGAIGSVFAFYCFIQGIMNVSAGKRSPLPVIGQITLIK